MVLHSLTNNANNSLLTTVCVLVPFRWAEGVQQSMCLTTERRLWTIETAT